MDYLCSRFMEAASHEISIQAVKNMLMICIVAFATIMCALVLGANVA